jgi:glucose/arabinose dehydrogenase
VNKRPLLVTAIVLLVGISAIFYPKVKNYISPPESKSLNEGEMVVLRETPTPSKEPKVVNYKVQEMVTGLSVPWSIVFTSSDRYLVSEREGRVRVVEKGILKNDPLITFPETSHTGEEGVLGLALDPDYQSNKFVYVVVAYKKDSKLVEKIVRMKDLGASLSVDTIIFDNIPAAVYHDGGRLRFGWDKKLYVSTGDATVKTNAQKTDSVSGKLLRINSDGSIPSDNPFYPSPVYSLGHRNPQGFDWYPDSHVLWETEHGPSGNDGPLGGDEVNVIEEGANYGWPVVSHTQSKDGMVSPKIVFTPAIAPASGMFYTGNTFPQLKNSFLFGGLKGEGIYRVVVDAKAASQVVSYGKLEGISVGRVRDIVQAPDGSIYFTTSNMDGRGIARAGDDKILRLAPQK